ncbi:MAG: hypothetical protein ACJAZN_000554 [Planctomycetota bacterium]|jgi:hypothetical protein
MTAEAGNEAISGPIEAQHKEPAMMIRKTLGISFSIFAFAVATKAVEVQVANYELAAELDRLEVESEWNSRRCSGLISELERFEFDLEAQHTRGTSEERQRPNW